VGPAAAAVAVKVELRAGMGHLAPCKVKGRIAGLLELGKPPAHFALLRPRMMLSTFEWFR